MSNRFLNNTFLLTVTNSSNFVFINFIIRQVSSQEERWIYIFNIKHVKNNLIFALSAALQFFLPTDMRNI